MNSLFKIFRFVWVRSASFVFPFLFGCGIVYFSVGNFAVNENASTRNKEARTLNVKVYKRKPKEDCSRPNPLMLSVKLDKNKRLTLNMENFDFEDTSKLEEKLSERLIERKTFEVFNDKKTQIEKTVFIQLENSADFGDLIKITDALTRAGADPIFIDPFNEQCRDGGGGG